MVALNVDQRCIKLGCGGACRLLMESQGSQKPRGTGGSTAGNSHGGGMWLYEQLGLSFTSEATTEAAAAAAVVAVVAFAGCCLCCRCCRCRRCRRRCRRC